MSIPIFIVDAFADRPFTGNPAAVCLIQTDWPDEWLQAVAMEMNLSETAFVRSIDGGFGLRWFTPTVEVDLCGHATLASAHVLWETGRVSAVQPIQFQCRSGRLICTKTGSMITMDFPAKVAIPADPLPGLQEALGTTFRWCGLNGMDVLVELESAETVRRLTPDLIRLAALRVRGVIVTARSGEEGVDFISRFFAPAAGVPEDPVTGSAHCALAPFWSERLGKTKMVGYQASRRGGTVRVEFAGDRVFLSGRAGTTVAGELRV